jgi:hypothetical protein
MSSGWLIVAPYLLVSGWLVTNEQTWYHPSWRDPGKLGYMNLRLRMSDIIVSRALQANSHALTMLTPGGCVCPSELLANVWRVQAGWAFMRPLLGKRQYRAAHARMRTHADELAHVMHPLDVLLTTLGVSASGKKRSRACLRMAQSLQPGAPHLDVAAAGEALRADSDAWLQLVIPTDASDEELIRAGCVRWYKKGRNLSRDAGWRHGRRWSRWVRCTAGQLELIECELSEGGGLRTKGMLRMAARLERHVYLMEVAAVLDDVALGKKDRRRVHGVITAELRHNWSRVQRLAASVYEDRPRVFFEEVCAAARCLGQAEVLLLNEHEREQEREISG